MGKIRVIAAVVDTKRLQLYKEDGKTIEIQQGDPRLAGIVEAAEPLANPAAFKLPKNANGSYYLDIEIPEREIQKDNTIAEYEEKVGGFTRFFRVAKHKLAEIFLGKEEEEVQPVEPVVLGNPVPVKSTPLPAGVTQSTGIVAGGGENIIKPFELDRPAIELPKKQEETAVSEPKEEDTRKDPKISAAIADIMANAEPVSDPSFNVDDTKEDETIIAVVEDKNGEVGVVADVQLLNNHMAAAAKSGNTKGMQAFLARLAAANKKRNHTVDELLKFMEKGDLPLADDGSIIAYKVLRSTPKWNNTPALAPGEYVDCHSGKVVQRVGSYVCQSESIIDQSRAECSTGLHIARRGYLGGFSGDIITMVKINPEDVVSVPAYDMNKMRVCGYHIIGLVPKNEHQNLRTNKAMEGTNALKLLTMAIQGDHIDIIERVEITAAMGGSFIRTPVEGAKGIRPQLKKETVPTAPIVEVPKTDPLPMNAAPIDPKVQAKKVSEVKSLTVGERARALFTDGKIAELIDYKKKAKKSYSALGFTPEEEALIVGSGGSPMTNGQPAVKPVAQPKPKIDAKSIPSQSEEKFSSKAKPAKAEPKKTVEAKEKAAKPTKTVPSTNERTIPKMEGSRKEVARQLFDKAAGGDKASWGHLWLHRKECKKSWEILGFNAKEIDRIKTNKPDWV